MTVKEPFNKNYEHRTSPDFSNLATPLQEAIDNLYSSVPGRQSATVIKIQLV